MATENIYAYREYRKFLVDTIEARKMRIKGYSRAKFAKALGFASDAGLNMVLTGKRELRSPYLDRCLKNLRLNIGERMYFEAMVRAAHLPPSQRGPLLKEVEMLSSSVKWEAPKTESGIRLLDFFVVQQSLCLLHGHVSPEEIHSLFRYKISLSEIEQILLWMLGKGIVHAQGQTYKILKSVLMSKDEVPDSNLRRMHHDCFQLAAQALESDPIEAREFQTYLMTMDTKRLPEMKEKMKKMVLELIAEFETEENANTIAQIHFNIFQVIDKQKLPSLRIAHGK
jgi:uncharacterized protein (TIGR02147 family)